MPTNLICYLFEFLFFNYHRPATALTEDQLRLISQTELSKINNDAPAVQNSLPTRSLLALYDFKWNNSSFGFFFNYLNFSNENFLFLHKTTFDHSSALQIINKTYDETTYFSHLNFFSNDEFFIYFTEKLYLQTQFYQKKSSFINFFIENFIDVPICFKTSKSLKRKINELQVLKFVSLLSKKGKLEKTTRAVIAAYQNFLLINNFSKTFTLFSFSKWKPFFRIFYYQYFQIIPALDLNFQAPENQNVFYSFLRDFDHLTIRNDEETIHKIFEFPQAQFISLAPGLSTQLHAALELTPSFNYMTDTANFFKNSLIQLLGRILPIFSFFIYNVDKKVRKFSRGRSGKYIFIWKYVAKYKRFRVILKLITKQIKFYQRKTLASRLSNLFEELAANAPNGFLRHKITFAYNYVFKNCKRTLLTNYKTLTS